MGTTPRTCDTTAQWQNGAPCPFICSAGACTGSCVPGHKQCMETAPETCDMTGQWQSGAPCPFVCSAGFCTGVCTPGATQCNGNVSQTCDATGQWQGSSSCQFGCSAGGCLPDPCMGVTCTMAPTPICTSATTLRSYSSNGTCQGGTCSYQYTDTTCPNGPTCFNGACGLCTPGAPVCSGTMLTTCDAMGVDYTPGGTDCAPEDCSSGACASALFFEDFEDGTYMDDWFSPVPGCCVKNVVPGGADGTKSAMCISKTMYNETGDGIMQFLPFISPTYIGWWARPFTKYSNFVAIYPSNGTGSYLLRQIYDSFGNVSLEQFGSDITIPRPLGVWYHTELKNIDWAAGTYDYYVDGNLVASHVTWQHPGNQVGNFEFYHYGVGASGCIDQILMK